MKAVLISIRPEWCGKIAAGEKTIEVRKSFPNLPTPFKCYIYCTHGRKIQFWRSRRYSYADDHSHNQFDRCGNGKVIGEFVCDYITRSDYEYDDDDPHYNPGPRATYWPHVDLDAACLSYGAMMDYGRKKPLYSWHISDLKIYEEPLPVSAFFNECIKQDCEKCGQLEYDAPRNAWWCDDKKRLKRPPQSWCYVEELP